MSMGKVLYLQCSLVVTWLVPHKTAAVLARSMYTMQPCTISCHFIQSRIHRVLAGLAVTCTFGRTTGFFYVLLQ